uniref:Uncharacterized protein n=1 Tax=Glossina palpalis gambiensis TaxID=67801 RepID=A0A1B0BDN5_9MUSC
MKRKGENQLNKLFSTNILHLTLTVIKDTFRADGDCKPRAVGFVDTNEVVADADVIVVAATAKGVLAVSNDNSLSLCNEALMRSGLRGGGSGGSEAAIVGPQSHKQELYSIESFHFVFLMFSTRSVMKRYTRKNKKNLFLNAFAIRSMMTLAPQTSKATS